MNMLDKINKLVRTYYSEIQHEVMTKKKDCTVELYNALYNLMSESGLVFEMNSSQYARARVYPIAWLDIDGELCLTVIEANEY